MNSNPEVGVRNIKYASVALGVISAIMIGGIGKGLTGVGWLSSLCAFTDGSLIGLLSYKILIRWYKNKGNSRLVHEIVDYAVKVPAEVPKTPDTVV